MSRAIHIALTFDDSFWTPAYAIMRSAALTSVRPSDLVFHLLHKGLSVASRRELDAVTAEFGVTLRDYPLDADPVWRWNVGNAGPEHEALEPFVLHYSGDFKPWTPFSGVAFAQLYRHVMTNDVFYRYLRYRLARRLKLMVGITPR